MPVLEPQYTQMDANGLEHLWGAAASGDDAAAIEGVKTRRVSVTLRGGASPDWSRWGRCCFLGSHQGDDDPG